MFPFHLIVSMHDILILKLYIWLLNIYKSNEKIHFYFFSFLLISHHIFYLYLKHSISNLFCLKSNSIYFLWNEINVLVSFLQINFKFHVSDLQLTIFYLILKTIFNSLFYIFYLRIYMKIAKLELYDLLDKKKKKSKTTTIPWNCLIDFLLIILCKFYLF
jgi:hypothetical protein